jgi:hypothetical protein
MNPLVSWLFQQPNNYSSSTHKDISDHLFQTLLELLSSCGNIGISLSKELFKINFYLFMFQDIYPTSSMDYEDEEYISMKYTSDIVDTFLDMKHISDSYGVKLLNNKTADSLLQFIISNCYLFDESELIDNEDDTKEYYDEYE